MGLGMEEEVGGLGAFEAVLLQWVGGEGRMEWMRLGREVDMDVRGLFF